MYCPVDGDEFREGMTRCPEHEVDLVPDPPELDVPRRWLDRLDGVFLRVVLGAGVLAGIVYGVAGAASGILYALILRQDDLTSPNDTWALLLQDISRAAFPVVIGAVGILGGAVLFRAYANLGESGAAPAPDSDAAEEPPRFATEIMRVLFVLSIIFILFWAATGILTAKDMADYAFGAASPFGAQEGPDDWFITLTTVNNLAYFAGTTCLLLMGVRLALTAYLRLAKREAQEQGGAAS